MVEFADKFPSRFYDVAIAEQHAMTFAAGLACEGKKPVLAIYSTFLQRAYDQLIHDVGIQNLPVSFVLDRAGIVGADGPTHQGQYDISYMRSIPNFVLMAPKDESELQRMLITSINHKGPTALRIPRGSGLGVAVMDEGWEPLNIGEAEILEEGEDILIIAYGSKVASAIETANILKNINIPASIIIIHPVIVLNVGMSLNKKNPITIDQTISEYSNIEVTDVEYELYALNTQVNAIVAKKPIIRINFQVWLISLNHSLKINLTVGLLKLSNCPDPKIKNKKLHNKIVIK